MSEEGGRRRKKKEKKKYMILGEEHIDGKKVETGELLWGRYGNILLITCMKLKRTNKVTR